MRIIRIQLVSCVAAGPDYAIRLWLSRPQLVYMLSLFLVPCQLWGRYDCPWRRIYRPPIGYYGYGTDPYQYAPEPSLYPTGYAISPSLPRFSLDPYPAGRLCTDQSYQCPAWASTGQCSASPVVMQSICPRSCGTCSLGMSSPYGLGRNIYDTAMETTEAPRPVATSGFSKLIVNRKRQEGNPVLKYVTNVRYEWGDIGPDFECGSTCGVVYLTMKYHRLHPDYVHTRLGGTQENKYACKEPRHQLRELNMLCYRMDWTLIVCYSVEEAGEYIENLKLVETRDPSAQRKQQTAVPQDERTTMLNAAIGILTAARSVTKADAQRLLHNFGSLKNVAEASEEQLALCVGLGPIKAKNLYNFLRTDLAS